MDALDGSRRRACGLLKTIALIEEHCNQSEDVMKPLSASLVLLALLMTTVQFADGEAALEGGARKQVSSIGEDLPTAEAIVTDDMVLPLMGSTDHFEGRIAFAKAELKITPAQLPLWNAFVAAARSNAELEKQMVNASPSIAIMETPAANLPQRLAAHERQLEVHLAMLRKIAAALQPLYTSFNKEQRQSAETLPGSMIGLG
jgi:hypothetical protein